MSYKAKKRLGQNFLIDEYIINKIIKAIDPQDGDVIVEIGSGYGALTINLLKYKILLHVIEIDDYLVEKLRKITINDKILIHHTDILKFDFNIIEGFTKIVGNLPYNISTSILVKLTNYVKFVSSMCFMVQKEVALRISANINQKSYGRLSVFLQYFFDIEYLFDIDPQSFSPKPKVTSTLIRLIPKKNYAYNVVNIEDFISILKNSFHMKRKTIHNNLKYIISDKDLIKLDINPNSRPENISLNQYVKLSNYYTNIKKLVK